MTGPLEFVLVCTDRDAPDHVPPIEVWNITFHGPPEDVTAEHLTISVPNSMLELDCAKCRRTPRFRNATMRKLAQAAVDRFRAGERRVTFDVSKLSR